MEHILMNNISTHGGLPNSNMQQQISALSSSKTSDLRSGDPQSGQAQRSTQYVTISEQGARLSSTNTVLEAGKIISHESEPSEGRLGRIYAAAKTFTSITEGTYQYEDEEDLRLSQLSMAELAKEAYDLVKVEPNDQGVLAIIPQKGTEQLDRLMLASINLSIERKYTTIEASEKTASAVESFKERISEDLSNIDPALFDIIHRDGSLKVEASGVGEIDDVTLTLIQERLDGKEGKATRDAIESFNATYHQFISDELNLGTEYSSIKGKPESINIEFVMEGFNYNDKVTTSFTHAKSVYERL